MSENEIEAIKRGKVTSIAMDAKSREESIEALINLIRMERTNSLRKQKLEELKKLTAGQSEVSFANNLRRILTLSAQADGGFEINEELEKLLSKALGGKFEIAYDQSNFGQFLQVVEGDAGLKDLLSNIGFKPGEKPTQEQLTKLTDLINNDKNVSLRDIANNHKLLVSVEDNSLMDLLHGVGIRFDIDYEHHDLGFDSHFEYGGNFDQFVVSLDETGNAGLKTLLSDIGLKSGHIPTPDQLKKLTKLINDTDNVDLRHLAKKYKLLKSKTKYSKAEKDNIVESIRLFVDQKHSLNDMSIQSLIRLESEMDQTYQYLMSVIKTFSDSLRTLTRNIRGN